MAAFWTEAEDEELKRAYGAGMDYPQIAKLLGKSLHAIKGRRQRLGLPLRLAANVSWTPEDNATLLKLLSQRLEHRVIAEMMGRSRSAVKAQSYALNNRTAHRRGPRETGRVRRRLKNAKRDCLKCGQTFAKEWETNFLCRPCRVANSLMA